jgi:hypothetical protein
LDSKLEGKITDTFMSYYDYSYIVISVVLCFVFVYLYCICICVLTLCSFCYWPLCYGLATLTKN